MKERDQAIAVGSVAVAPGEKRIGYVPVLERPTGPIPVPIGIVCGRRPGPTVCITAGIHGGEYVGIEAAIRTLSRADPPDMRGTLIVVPICNVPGFEAAVPYVVPLDNKNLNRVFPGRADGTASEILADFLLTNVVSQADFLIDLHGGDLPESLVPFCIFFQTGNDEVDVQSESLARVYNLDWIERQTLDGGVTGVMVAEAVRRDKPAIVAEVGALGTYREEDIQRHMTGIRNVLQHLGLWEGEPEGQAEGPPIMTGRFVVTARQGGLFYPQAQIGERVEAGETLGEIRDPFGSLLEEVRAPAAGVLWVLFPSRVVHSGSVLYKAWTERVG